MFRYADGINAFDLGVIEVSRPAENVNNDTKGNRDFGKVHRAMAGMLDILGDLVGEEWDVMKRLQVLGIKNTGTASPAQPNPRGEGRRGWRSICDLSRCIFTKVYFSTLQVGM